MDADVEADEVVLRTALIVNPVNPVSLVSLVIPANLASSEIANPALALLDLRASVASSCKDHAVTVIIAPTPTLLLPELLE